jgi:CHAT domain-containing protein
MRCDRALYTDMSIQKNIGFHRPRLWWCVTGEFSFLPIHAAGIHQDGNLESASDYFISSYIPTLSALATARKGWDSLPSAMVTGVLAGCATSPRQVPLLNVEREIEVTKVCFERAAANILHLSSPNTAVQVLREALEGQSAHILHLACHGEQADSALESAFLLSDGKLAIHDLMTMRLPDAVIAFLSACQTARGSSLHPDQAVHLAASMLFCGFRSVVGTMW